MVVKRHQSLLPALFLTTKGGSATVVKCYAGSTAKERLRNGQKTWKALEEKYNACGNAPHQELYDCQNSTMRQRGQDPDEFLYHVETARNRLADHRRLL